MFCGHTMDTLMSPQATVAMPATESVGVAGSSNRQPFLAMARPSSSLSPRGMLSLRSEMGPDSPNQIHRPAVSASQSASAKQNHCRIAIPTIVSYLANADRLSIPW